MSRGCSILTIRLPPVGTNKYQCTAGRRITAARALLVNPELEELLLNGEVTLQSAPLNYIYSLIIGIRLLLAVLQPRKRS